MKMQADRKKLIITIECESDVEYKMLVTGFATKGVHIEHIQSEEEIKTEPVI